MSLNPNRAPTVSPWAQPDTPLRAEAEAQLARFRAVRADLERQVRRGDLTPRVARERAQAEAEALRQDLDRRAGQGAANRGPLRERLVAAAEARRQAARSPGAEGLQRESLRLLRQLLVEQQLQGRAAEFEGRAFVRPMAGGPPAPSLDRLLDLHAEATRTGDAGAAEWARRQLHAQRSRVLAAEDRDRIDAATHTPDRLAESVAARHEAELAAADPDARAALVAGAIEAGDASACAAAFRLASRSPEEADAPWVRAVLDGLGRFPDAALDRLREESAAAQAAEAEAARAVAGQFAAIARADARLAGLTAPDDATLRRQAALAGRPLAAPDEPVGLTLDRRGRLADDPDPTSPPGPL